MDNDPKLTERGPNRAGNSEANLAETNLAEMSLDETGPSETRPTETRLTETRPTETSPTKPSSPDPHNPDPHNPDPHATALPDLSLAELVCARLCHDLSGLLGSLTGTLELVTEAGPPTEELAVATDTAVALTLRLRLLRAAWAGPPEPLDLPELAALARGLPASRVGLDVSHLPPATIFPPAMGRLVLNLLLLAAASLPQGGTLYLDGAADDVIARIAGPRAAWPAGLIGMLADPTIARRALGEPRTLQAPLTALLARHHGLRLTAMLSTGPAELAPPLRLCRM
jgi:histidine phosphotransferase ChpT